MTQEHSPEEGTLESITIVAEQSAWSYNAAWREHATSKRLALGRWRLPDLISTGLIEKVGHGLYRSRNCTLFHKHGTRSGLCGCAKGVIFLTSALAYYRSQHLIPPEICVAVGAQIQGSAS